VNDVDDERIKILVIEDNPGDACLLVEMLIETEWGPFDLERANRLSRGLERLAVGDWDTGIGIPAEQMDRLFEPFVQLDSSLSREHEGTGLGLALVRRLSDMHGGSVAVESKVGQGSRFTVSLPWQRPPEDDMRDGEQGHVARQASGTPTPAETDVSLNNSE
jgi:hypothetical protein